jgi:FSR family fosmidomycin resistance protein-like MFS transporter
LAAHRDEASVKIILALSLIHFIGDFYNSFIIPLLPLFIDKFSLTQAQAGLIAGLSRFLAFVVQPPVGYGRISCRFSPLAFFCFRRPFAGNGVYPPDRNCAPFFGAAPVRLSGLHWIVHVLPGGAAGMVEPYAGRHFGRAMSIFGTGGTLSFAIGPLLSHGWSLDSVSVRRLTP